MVIISVLDVEVRYRSLKALDGVTFEIGKGEVASIIGPNGSGKTTLLKTIDGILRPYRGSVYVDMKNVERIPRRELAKLVGYVPQIATVWQGIKVIDFVITGRRPHIKISPVSRDVDIALEKLRIVEAEHLADRDLNELSGGELQRVLIARALASEPNILLLDEPTSNLDIKYQREILEIIRGLSKKGITTIMTLHDLIHAYRYSDKVVMIRDGRVFAVGRPDEVLTEESIERVYGVKVLVLRELKAVVTLI